MQGSIRTDDGLELFGCGPTEVVQVDFVVFAAALLDKLDYAPDRGAFFGEWTNVLRSRP
jgi:hypothetical protein